MRDTWISVQTLDDFLGVQRFGGSLDKIHRLDAPQPQNFENALAINAVYANKRPVGLGDK
ncbi:hypothetical protein ACVWXM_002406 [Bradyrhizobium sp. GM7.3]